MVSLIDEWKRVRTAMPGRRGMNRAKKHARLLLKVSSLFDTPGDRLHLGHVGAAPFTTTKFTAWGDGWEQKCQLLVGVGTDERDAIQSSVVQHFSDDDWGYSFD